MKRHHAAALGLADWYLMAPEQILKEVVESSTTESLT
jgi:hypothetical protein